jgi:hypothetical protein
MMKMVEWELTMECNFKCEYCTNLDDSIIAEKDKGKLDIFIDKLQEMHPTTMIFLFGGEPLLHPHILHIIDRLLANQMEFIIQTNFSKKSVHVLNKIKEDVDINISIHPSEIELGAVIELFKKINKNIKIQTIDVMYLGVESEQYYLAIEKGNISCDELVLTPVVDFTNLKNDFKISEFNRKKGRDIYKKLFNFESVERQGELRADLWEKMENGRYSTKGKPCIYQNKYFLYSSDLKEYNCCYREEQTGICQHDKCFLM